MRQVALAWLCRLATFLLSGSGFCLLHPTHPSSFWMLTVCSQSTPARAALLTRSQRSQMRPLWQILKGPPIPTLSTPAPWNGPLLLPSLGWGSLREQRRSQVKHESLWFFFQVNAEPFQSSFMMETDWKSLFWFWGHKYLKDCPSQPGWSWHLTILFTTLATATPPSLGSLFSEDFS